MITNITIIILTNTIKNIVSEYCKEKGKTRIPIL